MHEEGIIQPTIKCRAGEVAKYVLLPGDPERTHKIASFSHKAIEQEISIAIQAVVALARRDEKS